MNRVRLLPVVVVAVAVVALASWWDGSPVRAGGELGAPPLPVAGGPSALSATWFCAAGTAGTPKEPSHSLVLSNPSGSAALARLTAYGNEGVAGTKEVEVPAGSVLRIGVGEEFGEHGLSVMVETASGELAVEHRLVTAGAADQVPCATSSSERWYFPSQDTSQVVDDDGTITRTSNARLVLFNPFSSDAGVDISAAVEDGLRVPSTWQGIVVPAGTIRVVDLGEEAQRRDQFSITVVSRTGRVVAETVQAYTEGDSAAGVRLQLGVPEPAPEWGLAAGFTGAGASERLVVMNPGERSASVVVQVTPVGGAEMPPEPFQLEVAPRRYGVIDLSAETRVPGTGFHSIQVETDEDTPVVVGRVTTISAGPEEPAESADPEAPAAAVRPSIDGGTAIGTGTPLVAARWTVPLVIAGGGQTPAFVVQNPGTGIVVVSATTYGHEGEPVTVLDEVEVPARDGLVVPLAGLDLPAGDVGVSVTASSPVFVGRAVTFVEQDDLSLGPAVPVRPEGRSRLPLLFDL